MVSFLRVWTLSAGLLVSLGTASAAADEPGPSGEAVPVVEVPVAPAVDPAEVLAKELGIAETEEAALVLLDPEGVVTAIRRGGSPVDLKEARDVARAVWVLRRLPEGMHALVVESEDRVWEGPVQVYRGRVTLQEAQALLRQGIEKGPPAGLDPGMPFDLFTFYDALDARRIVEQKLQFCSAVLETLSGGPDREAVSASCSRLQRTVDQAAAEDEAVAAMEDEGGDLEALLLGESSADAMRPSPDHRILYRGNGMPRSRPRTTLPSALAAAGGITLGAGLVGTAFLLESKAAVQYIAYREAERMGDDPLMSETLFHTQDFDRQRDLAVGVATLSFTGAAVALVVHQLEKRRFEAARSRIRGNAK